MKGGNPLAGFGSPSEYHPHATASSSCSYEHTKCLSQPIGTTRPFRGFFPCSVFPTAESHVPPMGSHPTGCVAPPGFLTLPTPCSPRSLPSLFHPGPALGVRPSRPCSSRGAVRPPGRRSPHGVAVDAIRRRAPLQGLAHQRKSRAQIVGFSHKPRRIPPWASSSLRFLTRPGQSRHYVATSPLSRFVDSIAR
jgi:hypothetical protein